METLTLIETNGNSWQDKAGDYVRINYGGRMMKGILMKDYNKIDDGIFWVMQKNPIIKSSYTAEDAWEETKFSLAPIIKDGDIVTIWHCKDHGDKIETISKKRYELKVFGNYSDCAIFDEVRE